MALVDANGQSDRDAKLRKTGQRLVFPFSMFPGLWKFNRKHAVGWRQRICISAYAATRIKFT